MNYKELHKLVEEDNMNFNYEDEFVEMTIKEDIDEAMHQYQYNPVAHRVIEEEVKWRLHARGQTEDCINSYTIRGFMSEHSGMPIRASFSRLGLYNG